MACNLEKVRRMNTFALSLVETNQEYLNSEPVPVLYSHAGRKTTFAPVKSLRFSELFLGILLSKFRFTVFFGVDSWTPPLPFFETAKGKAPKEARGGHLSGWGINITFLRPHKPQLSAMRCVALNQIDPSHMMCIRSFVVLFPHYSILSSLLPFRCADISRKGRVVWSFVLIGFIKELFEV